MSAILWAHVKIKGCLHIIVETGELIFESTVNLSSCFVAFIMEMKAFESDERSKIINSQEAIMCSEKNHLSYDSAIAQTNRWSDFGMEIENMTFYLNWS